MLDALAASLRHGARILRSAPGMSAAVVATLALTLGTAAATFSVYRGATAFESLSACVPWDANLTCCRHAVRLAF